MPTPDRSGNTSPIDSSDEVGKRDVRYAADAPAQERFWLRIIGITSAVLVGAVLFLIYGPRPQGSADGGRDVSMLPHVNAGLNALSGLLLIVGYRFIRAGRINAHKRTMLTAFAASGAFLVSYLIYHTFKAGPKPYEGGLPWLYYPILISHILLAAVIVPLALVTLYRGWNWEMQVEKHRRIAKITLPLWLYVSVTGVLIWGMLYL